MHLSQANFTGDRQNLGDRDYCIAGESSRERTSLPKGTEKRKKIPQRIRYAAANKESYLVA
jgi:hypothetical protein